MKLPSRTKNSYLSNPVRKISISQVAYVNLPLITFPCHNPFDAEVMNKVEKNLRKYPYGSIIICNKPIHREAFEPKGWRKKVNQSITIQIAIL